jgi:serine O-acetyltransferase
MNIIDGLSLVNEIKKLFQKYYFIEFQEAEYYDLRIYNEVISKFLFDYNRYFSDNFIARENLFSRVELIGILFYRLSHSFFLNNRENVSYHYSNCGRLISGFEIYYSASIGKGIKINHGLGTVIGARCIIGEYALIHQNVTLGDKNGGRPILLDNVIVYAGATILGEIILGNNSTVAANCVCMINVPDFGLIAGVPGIVKK